MSARVRQFSDRYALPDNSKIVEFERSDGNPNVWPTNNTPVVDDEGCVNFMQPVDLDQPISIKWRVQVGAALGNALNWPEGPAYVLKGWPEGYRMFDHHKGKQSAPRHDVYLFGYPKARFRSVPEFVPHAIWLMEDPTLDTSNCQCKYCSKKAQRDITSSMSSILRSTTSQSPAPRFRRESGSHRSGDKAKEQRRDRKVFSAVQRVPKPLKPSSRITKYSMVPERNSDLRAVHATTGLSLKRWFRQGELLWCALDPPIPGKKGDGDSIRFWPGLVDEVKLKSETTPRSSHVDSVSTSGQGLSTGSGDQLNSVGQGATNEGGSGSLTLWTVRQSTVYKMRLLAVSHTYFASDDKVVPYQAYAPPLDLIHSLQEHPAESLDLSPERMKAFNPCPQVTSDPNFSPPNFTDAVSPYAVAIQIGAKLSGYWCLTDDWDFKYTVQPVVRPVASTGLTSLQSAIIAAGSRNAALSENASNTPSQYQNVTGPSNKMTQTEVQQIANRTLGPPPPFSQTITQTRYQGLWWGAERIWTDDFVRLKVPRRCLAPRGAENIYPPSGPGKSVREKWGSDVEHLGAGARGVFMRLDGLFVVDVPQHGGTKKECRASGMLYELADEDWEDPQEVNSSTVTTNPTPLPAIQQAPASNGSLPLGGSPLPNFDPSVPVASTSSAVFAVPTLAQDSSPSTPLPNSQLSHPTPTPYLLPPPPIGYKFRPILPPGYESVMSLSLLSGRYYPRLLSHPLLAPILQQAMSNPSDDAGLMENNHLWALEGLSAGFYNSVDPTKSKREREVMVMDADREARAELEAHVQAMKQQKAEELPGQLVYEVPMDDGN